MNINIYDSTVYINDQAALPYEHNDTPKKSAPVAEEYDYDDDDQEEDVDPECCGTDCGMCDSENEPANPEAAAATRLLEIATSLKESEGDFLFQAIGPDRIEGWIADDLTHPVNLYFRNLKLYATEGYQNKLSLELSLAVAQDLHRLLEDLLVKHSTYYDD